MNPTTYGIKIHGVLHIGAHLCEEKNLYESWGVSSENIIWVDAIPRCEGVHKAVISNTDGEKVTFYTTNNHQSSSILEMGTHQIRHPYVTVTGSEERDTTTIDTFMTQFPPELQNSINYVHLDIQGAELKALQGALTLLPQVDAIMTEVNVEHLYKDCALLPEIDAFLASHGFQRVWTDINQHNWGDALYLTTKKIPTIINTINMEFVETPFVFGGVDPSDEYRVWSWLSSNHKVKTAFDVGARDSVMPLVFEQVALFEPNPISFERLVTLHKNTPNVQFYDYGISDTAETLCYYNDWETFVKRTVHVQCTSPPIQLTTKTFADAVADTGFIPEFVKIDVEGYELKVIQSMQPYLPQIKAVQFEIGGTCFDANFTLADIYKCFPSCYKIYNIEGNGTKLNHIPVPFEWSSSVWANSNMIALNVEQLKQIN